MPFWVAILLVAYYLIIGLLWYISTLIIKLHEASEEAIIQKRLAEMWLAQLEKLRESGQRDADKRHLVEVAAFWLPAWYDQPEEFNQ